MNRILLLPLSLSFILPAQSALIAYYELNESSGSAADSSGNAYDGSPANAGSGRVYGQASVPAGTYGAITISPPQSSSLGTSIDFGTDGSNFGNYNIQGAGEVAIDNLLEVGIGANNIDGQMTVMAWVNLDSVSGTQSIFSSNQGGGSDGWRFGTFGDDIRFTTLGAQDITQQANLTTGSWNHLAVTIDNDNVSFFLNGNLLGSQAATAKYIEEQNGFEVKLGGKATGAENMFGRMDEVKIFDTALSQAEIVSAATIPEPSSVLLASLGMLLLGRRQR